MTYLEFVEFTGLSQDQIDTLVNNTSDRINLPKEYSGMFELRESSIEGLGIFTTEFVGDSCILGPARLNSFRTELGRYMNHSDTPNTRCLILSSGDIYITATKDIHANEELTTDYSENWRVCRKFDRENTKHPTL